MSYANTGVLREKIIHPFGVVRVTDRNVLELMKQDEVMVLVNAGTMLFIFSCRSNEEVK